MPKSKLKKYTVVGFWEDQRDPWFEFGEGKTPHDGMMDALHNAMKFNSWSVDNMEGLTVLGVVEGHRRELLGVEEIFSADSVL